MIKVAQRKAWAVSNRYHLHRGVYAEALRYFISASEYGILEGGAQMRAALLLCFDLSRLLEDRGRKKLF